LRKWKEKPTQIIGGLLLGSLVFGLWLSWPRERDLIALADPVVSLKREEEAYWVSASHLVIITTDHYAIVAGKFGVDDWHGHADLISLPSRTRTRLAGLTKLLNRVGVTPMGAPSNFALSPDGKHLTWRNLQHLGRLSYRIATANRDGNEYRECKWLEAEPTFWIDDRHFAEAHFDMFANAAKVHVLDIRDANADCFYEPSSKEAKAILHRYYRSLPSDRVLECVPSEEAHPLIQIGHYRDGERLIGTSTYHVWLPKGARPVERQTSPQMTAMLYDLRFETAPPLLVWLHHFLPGIPANPVIIEGLWISWADGTEMREIGHVPGAHGWQLVEALQWLPDGKQISFTYRNRLYVVTAAPPK